MRRDVELADTVWWGVVGCFAELRLRLRFPVFSRRKEILISMERKRKALFRYEKKLALIILTMESIRDSGFPMTTAWWHERGVFMAFLF